MGWSSGSATRRELSATAAEGIRFAFYGRTSTTEFQHPATSRAWQRETAQDVISDRGPIVTEFFGVGCSRRVSRPMR
jgi:site-specific DNA recombinase